MVEEHSGYHIVKERRDDRAATVFLHPVWSLISQIDTLSWLCYKPTWYCSSLYTSVLVLVVPAASSVQSSQSFQSVGPWLCRAVAPYRYVVNELPPLHRRPIAHARNVNVGTGIYYPGTPRIFLHQRMTTKGRDFRDSESRKANKRVSFNL